MATSTRYRNLAANIAVFALNTLATKLVAFLLVPLYTAYLTDAQYGLTDLAYVVTNLLLPVATLSLSDAMVRFALDAEKDRAPAVTYAFLATAASVAVAAVATLAFDLPVFGGLGAWRGWFVAAYAATAFQNFFSDASRSIEQVKLIPAASIVSSLVTFASAYLLIARAGWRVEGYFASLVLGAVAGIAVYVTFGRARRFIRPRALASNRPLLRRMLAYSLPLMPNALFWWAGTSLNRFFITGLLGIGASGLFAAANKLPSMVNVVYNSFQQAWTLSVFEGFRERGAHAFYATVYRVLDIALTLLVVLLVLFSRPISTVFLQGDFLEGWVFVPVLMLSAYLNAFSSFIGTVYTATMNTKFLFTTTFFGALAIVVLTPVLLGLLGTAGAAWAMLASNAIVLCLRAAHSRTIMDIGIRPAPFAAKLVMLCVLAWATAQSIPAVAWPLAVVAVADVAIYDVRKLRQLVAAGPSR